MGLGRNLGDGEQTQKMVNGGNNSKWRKNGAKIPGVKWDFSLF